ncbi:HAD-like domain-containing protein [Suillus lakei]|nr:HAD-like domain-containing protein [Suillus lakei]
MRLFKDSLRVLHSSQDGVLIRGKDPLPAAKEALSILDGNNKLSLKIPFIPLTNGGGVSEEERCRKLSSQLGVQINPDQFIQAHTVLKSVVHKYADVPVLVLGGKGDTLRRVAEGKSILPLIFSLGTHCKLSATFIVLTRSCYFPRIWPFHDLTHEERASVRPTDFSKIRFSAIFVFHDPRNWALDTQIMCDVIQGIIEASHACNHTRKPIDLSLTGSTYPYIQFGKPTEATYKFAGMMLQHRLQGVSKPSLYMIGGTYITILDLDVTLNLIVAADNPESDIAGANAAGWKSILVHTGVYDPHRGPPSHPPTHQAEDVAEAVHWALEEENCS